MQNKDTIWNAYGYLRLSKDDGDKDESNSIKNQRDLILDFASRNPAIRVIDILSDDGYTGANFDRTAFKRMKSHIEDGLINCVIVKDFSRLGRDHIETGRYIERYFKEKSVRFISINDNYDSLTCDMSGSAGSLLVPFKNIINEAFLEDISTKTKSQLAIKRKNGEFIGNYAVYGYLKDGKSLVPDDYAADIVRSIFSYKIGGHNESQIAGMLNAKGVLPPSEYKKSLGIAYATPFAAKERSEWSANTVKRILMNRVYIGSLEQGKRTKDSYRVKKISYRPRDEWSIHENAHESVISVSDFLLVSELMKKDTRVSPASSQLHMFSGLVVCGHCGQQMVIKSVKKSDKRYVYFTCASHKKSGACGNVSIRDAVIEKAALLSIERQIASFISAEKLNGRNAADTLLSRRRKTLEEQIENNLRIIENNNEHLVGAYKHLLDGVISESEYFLYKSSFNRQIAAAESAISGLREQIEKLNDNAYGRTLMEKFREHENITELSRSIVVNLIDCVFVYSDKDVRIQFRYSGKLEPASSDLQSTCRNFLKGRWFKMARKSRKNILAEPEIPQAALYVTFGYARISIDGERSEDSIDSQTAIIQDFVKDREDIDLCGVITDLGYTGRDFDRPGYTELLNGIQRGTIKCVIVKDLSRVGRTYIEVGELLFDTFPAYGVRFISVNDQYDSFADDAARKKLLILFKNLINHMYSRDLGKKIRSAHDAKKRRGELAGNTPYGYRRGEDGITLAFDDDAADIVRMVFDMRLAGNSANSIAKHLTREGIPSPQQRRYELGQISHEKYSGRIVWNVGMISKMLQNETYTGTLVQGKYDCDGKRHTLLPKEQWIRHENTHPAIISREQFDAVQTLMRETAAKYERGKGPPLPENCYKGKIFCKKCGKVITRGIGGVAGHTRFYFACRYCVDDIKAETGLTRVPNLTVTQLDSAVMETLKKQMDLLIDFDKLVQRLEKSEASGRLELELTQERLKHEKAVKDADKTLSTAYAHQLDGLLDLREFELVRARIENERRCSIAQLEQAESEFVKHKDMAVQHGHWNEVYNSFRSAKTPTKELIQALVARIELMPYTNELEVVMNYRDGFNEYHSLISGSEVSVDA